MKALIVTNITDEHFYENNFWNARAFEVVSNINKLLLKFENIVFISDQECVHESLEIENCQKDFYIFRKQKQNDNIFKNKEFQELFREKNVNEIYVVGFNLEDEVKKIAKNSIKSNYKTTVVEDATFNTNEDINKMLKFFKQNNVNFIESFELK